MRYHGVCRLSKIKQELYSKWNNNMLNLRQDKEREKKEIKKRYRKIKQEKENVDIVQIK